jgi:hypothetical protein
VLRVALASVVVVFLAAGATAASKPRPRTPYARSLAALCTDTRKRIEEIPRARTSGDLTRTTARIDEVGRQFVLRLAKLKPSAAERKPAEEMGSLYAAYWSGQFQAFVFLRRGIESGNASLLNVYTRALEVLDPYEVRAEQLATALGARECARQPVRK